MSSDPGIRGRTAGRIYAELLVAAKSDARVVGIVLGGSRGKGDLVTADSDYDVYVIVADEDAAADWRARYTSEARPAPAP
ncbi:MAG TPA: hypothetical protein VGF23_08350 [Gaiellaceae bacterium]|jgi:predicted nucleotidyltransferase